MDTYLNTASNLCLIVFVILTMIKIHFLEKQLKDLEKKQNAFSKPKRGFCCGIDEIKEPRYYTKDQK